MGTAVSALETSGEAQRKKSWAKKEKTRNCFLHPHYVRLLFNVLPNYVSQNFSRSLLLLKQHARGNNTNDNVPSPCYRR